MKGTFHDASFDFYVLLLRCRKLSLKIHRCSLDYMLQGSKKWHTWSYHGAWIRGVTAGGCGYPPNQGQGEHCIESAIMIDITL